MSVLDEAFWDDYTDRQAETDPSPTLRQILRPYLPHIRSVLEVGCNRGDNLGCFPEAEVEGVEPNEHARLQAQARGFTVLDAIAQDLPYPDEWFDLVFTAGVLIHIPPPEFDKALAEIHRVSARYVLAVEYHADKPTPVTYRGVPEGIWKRYYAAEYMDRFPLDIIGVGDQDSLAGTPFDGSSWVLLSKSGR